MAAEWRSRSFVTGSVAAMTIPARRYGTAADGAASVSFSRGV
jgi:hypothetical protein